MQERTLNKLKKRCLNTIRVLCRLVGNGKDDYFYVGYSSKAAYVGSPGRKGWNHVVVFADRLYCCDALNLEAAIHDSISHEQELSDFCQVDVVEAANVDAELVRVGSKSHRPRGRSLRRSGP
jgi:hypothetical protein